MVARLGNRDDPLPQDSFEGVDEDEWVSAGGGHTTPGWVARGPAAPLTLRPPAGLGWTRHTQEHPGPAGPGGGTSRRRRRKRWRRRRARRGQDPLLKPLHQHRVLP